MHKKRMTLIQAIVVLALLACGPAALVTPAPDPTPMPPAPTLAPTPDTPPVAPANTLEEQIVAVYEQAGPAVVNITTRSVTYDMFSRPMPQEGAGSGFLYDELGHVVTNYHVIENAESISVAFPNGEVHTAEVVGTDPSNDLAVVRVDGENLPAPIPLGDSDQLRVGQFVIAIGNPFRQESTLTVGVISALGRVIESPDGRFIGEAIQTDAAINPGNSGGPLLDLQGRVIGINSQIISPFRGSAGIGFAVSSNTIRRVVPELIATGRYPHPWLGVYLLDLSEWAEALRQAGVDVPVDAGTLVLEVVPDSPAAAGGVRGGTRTVRIGNYTISVGGDVITAINDEPLANRRELTVYLETQTRVGDTIEVRVIRDGQEETLELTLTERP